jgi:hypothetical protein
MFKSGLTGLLVLCFGIFQHASAQTCAGNNSVVGGSFVYVAVQTGTGVPAITGSVETSGGTGTVAYSNTELGQLLSGISEVGAFSSTGAISFNAFGQVFASSSPQSNDSALVGTYTLNADCTMSVTLNDPFGTIQTSTTLSGIVMNGGGEVDLFLAPSTSSSAGTTTPILAGLQSKNGLLIRLFRAYYSSFGCTVGNLSGAYALVLNGSPASSAIAAQPPVLILRAYFNGAGVVTTDPATTGSSLAALQSIGTYTVNSDCTGTLTLHSPVTSATSTSPNPSRTINFVLTAPTVVVNAGATRLDQYSTRPRLALSISEENETSFGFGTAQ